MHSTFAVGNGSSPEARLEYLYLNLMGQLVRVHTVDGAITEGLFLSRKDEDASSIASSAASSGGGIILRCYNRCSSAVHLESDLANFKKGDLLIDYSMIVFIEATNFKIRASAPGTGQVHSYRGNHDLEKLDWTGKEELLEDGLGSGPGAGGTWDQFKANDTLGVLSTYSEEKYTTALDMGTVSQQEIEDAERKAKEIERSTTHGVQHMLERSNGVQQMMERANGAPVDEGILFSNVVRMGGDDHTAPGGGKNGNKNLRGGAAAPPSATNPKKGRQQELNSTNHHSAATPGEGNTYLSAVNESSGTHHHMNASSPVDTMNVAAVPFTPTRPVFDDFIKELANAISANRSCYVCPPSWPGDEGQAKMSYQHSMGLGGDMGGYAPVNIPPHSMHGGGAGSGGYHSGMGGPPNHLQSPSAAHYHHHHHHHHHQQPPQQAHGGGGYGSMHPNQMMSMGAPHGMRGGMGHPGPAGGAGTGFVDHMPNTNSNNSSNPSGNSMMQQYPINAQQGMNSNSNVSGGGGVPPPRSGNNNSNGGNSNPRAQNRSPQQPQQPVPVPTSGAVHSNPSGGSTGAASMDVVGGSAASPPSVAGSTDAGVDATQSNAYSSTQTNRKIRRGGMKR